MKKAIVSLSIICGLGLAAVGCTQHESATSKETIKTPGGTTTVTTKQEVEKTGDHKDK